MFMIFNVTLGDFSKGAASYIVYVEGGVVEAFSNFSMVSCSCVLKVASKCKSVDVAPCVLELRAGLEVASNSSLQVSMRVSVSLPCECVVGRGSVSLDLAFALSSSNAKDSSFSVYSLNGQSAENAALRVL